jgi:hypothetical protein
MMQNDVGNIYGIPEPTIARQCRVHAQERTSKSGFDCYNFAIYHLPGADTAVCVTLMDDGKVPHLWAYVIPWMDDGDFDEMRKWMVQPDGCPIDGQTRYTLDDPFYFLRLGEYLGWSRRIDRDTGARAHPLEEEGFERATPDEPPRPEPKTKRRVKLG